LTGTHLAHHRSASGAKVLRDGGSVNASQNCCEGMKDVCKLDSSGIPRCFGGGSGSRCGRRGRCFDRGRCRSGVLIASYQQCGRRERSKNF
jgi:hypothetical protein